MSTTTVGGRCVNRGEVNTLGDCCPVCASFDCDVCGESIDFDADVYCEETDRRMYQLFNKVMFAYLCKGW